MSFLTIMQLIYFMLPAYLGNIAAEQMGKVFLKKWTAPIDLNKKINDKHILGPHKTYRGVLFGIAVAVIIAFTQSRLNSSLNLYDYSNWLLFGFLIGFGAMTGDIVKSFFKRRIGIKPGKPWIFDSIDFVLGALLLSSLVYFPGWKNVIAILLISFPLSVVVKRIGYALGLKKEKW